MAPVALPTLTDGEIVLRPGRPDDADDVTAACQDPEIPRWTLVPSPYTRAHAEEWLVRGPAEAAAGDAVRLLAVDGGDRLLGSFSVMEIDSARGYGEIGYWERRPPPLRCRVAGSPDEPDHLVYAWRPSVAR